MHCDLYCVHLSLKLKSCVDIYMLQSASWYAFRNDNRLDVLAKKQTSHRTSKKWNISISSFWLPVCVSVPLQDEKFLPEARHSKLCLVWWSLDMYCVTSIWSNITTIIWGKQLEIMRRNDNEFPNLYRPCSCHAMFQQALWLLGLTKCPTKICIVYYRLSLEISPL